MLAPDVGRDRRGEIAGDGRNAATAGDFPHIGRLDTEDAVVLEVREQGPVVRADVDDELLWPELQHGRSFRIELGKIVAQQLGRAARVGILGRKDDDGIDRQAELHQIAICTVEKVGGKPRLLPRHFTDRNHLVHRRHVTEREHGSERRMAADLAVFDRNAGASAGGTRDFCRNQCDLLLTVGLCRRRHALVRPIPFERRRQSFVERNSRSIAERGQL